MTELLCQSDAYLKEFDAVVTAGVCHEGDGIDLGGPLEFRESLEIAYRVDERWLVGLSIAHISNGQVYEHNPGQNDLLLTIAVGF